MPSWRIPLRVCFSAGKSLFNDEVYITNARHKEALEEAEDSLAMVKQSIEDGMPEDFFSIDLMAAYGSLGENYRGRSWGRSGE